MASEPTSSSETSQPAQNGGNVTPAPESGPASASESERQGTQPGSRLSAGSGQSGNRSMQQGSRGLSRGRASADAFGPFSLMRRFSEDMDRLFEGFFGPSLWSSEPLSMLGQSTRWPELEMHQEGNRWVVQADVPGLRREDVNVEVRDGELVISGERRSQSEKNERGFYRSERTYGSFSRAIPLPEGANLESASASFENGVLRIELEVPEQQQRSRRIEVREGSTQ